MRLRMAALLVVVFALGVFVGYHAPEWVTLIIAAAGLSTAGVVLAVSLRW